MEMNFGKKKYSSTRTYQRKQTSLYFGTGVIDRDIQIHIWSLFFRLCNLRFYSWCWGRKTNRFFSHLVYFLVIVVTWRHRFTISCYQNYEFTWNSICEFEFLKVLRHWMGPLPPQLDGHHPSIIQLSSSVQVYVLSLIHYATATQLKLLVVSIFILKP